MVKLGSVSVLLMLISSCLPPMIHNKRFLLQNKENNVADRVRKDGYYFYENKGKDNFGIKVIIFFENGFFKDIGFISAKDSTLYDVPYEKICPGMSNANEVTSALRRTECVLDNYSRFFDQYLNFYNKNSIIWDWGKYTISGDSLKIQYFYNHFGDYYLVGLSGVISADSTISLSKGYDYKTKKSFIVDLKYRFQKYNRKDIVIPDVIKSIN